MTMSASKIPKGQAQNVLKLCILGEGGVGKTTLTKRMITGTFDSATKMTIGVDFHILNTSIFDPFAPEDMDDPPQISINAQIWDFAGEERFRFMLPRYAKGAVGGILCYDLTRYSTTRYIEEWYGIWKENAPPNAPLMIAGTKVDMMPSEEEVQRALYSTKEIAESLGVQNYYVISSKTGKDVHILTNDLLTQGYKYNCAMLGIHPSSPKLN
jgi:Ras-related protein Rab-11A